MQNDQLIGLSRQKVMERQFDVIANNLANINTTGFKSSRSLFQEFLTGDARDNTFRGGDAQVHFVADGGAFYNFGQGPIQRTGNPLDIAIDGDSFLAVTTPNGERYTRNGALQIDANGQLVTNTGIPVAGDGGGPITFQPTDRSISISADGRITVLDGPTNVEALRGKLKVVSFAQPNQLRSEGGNMFSAPNGVTGQPPTRINVMQGAIEGSNVNGVLEMTRMVEVNRTYAMIAATMKTQDDMHRNTIDKLAAVPN
jgi:flagellar basal-body rod protein FlgF